MAGSETMALRALFLLVAAILGLVSVGAALHAQDGAPPKIRPAGDDSPADTDDPAADPAEEEGESELQTLDKIEMPSFERLMKGPPFDWVILTKDRVLPVEPLFPRPGTLADLNARMSKLMRRQGDPPETEDNRRKRMALYYLPLTLTEGEEREYKLHVKFIREIVYYEDLMLRRIDQLLEDKQVRKAYELLVALEERDANWQGIAPRREKLLFVDAQIQAAAGGLEQALSLLETLQERSPSYPGLEEQMVSVFDRLMSEALARKDPRQSRYFLKRLTRRYPASKLVVTWSNRLMQQARDDLGRAVAAERAGRPDEALDIAEEATRTWPELPETLPIYNRLSIRLQRLRVGVVGLAADPPAARHVVVTRDEMRRRQLAETPLFFPARFDDKIARYETRFFQEWDATELGHSVSFQIRSFRQPGDSQPPLTAAGLAESLGHRLTPGDPGYDARFAATVGGLSVRGPFELAVRFRQVPLRPEALFNIPYKRQAGIVSNSEVASTDPLPIDALAVTTYPFHREATNDSRRALFRRTVAEPFSTADRRVAEVIEIQYPSHEKAIQGLLRGEVSYLPRIPPATVKVLASRNEFYTQAYELPISHFLQFHPRQKALQSRALRRAMIYALDRRRILEELFLNESEGVLGRLTTAPWPTKSYAYNRFVTPHAYDPALAFSLAKNAERELGSRVPELRLWVPDDPELAPAAAQIVEAWRKIGITTRVVHSATPGAPTPTIDSDDWDVIYRAEVVAEPLVELWTLLALTNSTETTALSYLPTWLRHDLLELDRVGDWRSAEQLLHKIQKQFWAEVHLIPLWEVEESYVVRKNVRNLPEHSLFPYQGIERWKVDPWYSRD